MPATDPLATEPRDFPSRTDPGAIARAERREPLPEIGRDSVAGESPAAAPTIDGFVREAVRAVIGALPLVGRYAEPISAAALSKHPTEMLKAPDPSRTREDARFAAADPSARAALARSVPGAAPYGATATSEAAGSVVRTTLVPEKIRVDLGHLSFGLAKAAAHTTAAAYELGRLAATRAYVYTPRTISTAPATPSFADVRTRVASQRTKPKGVLLRSLQPLIDARRTTLPANDVDVEIVEASAAIEHPTYVAATFAGDARTGVPPSATLFKRGRAASGSDLRELDGFARRALTGARSVSALER